MTWSLNASGHTPTDPGESWAEVEQELHDELQKVLSNPKYGTANSRFSGNHVQGEPHKPKAVHAEAEAAEHHHGEDAPTHHQHKP